MQGSITGRRKERNLPSAGTGVDVAGAVLSGESQQRKSPGLEPAVASDRKALSGGADGAAA